MNIDQSNITNLSEKENVIYVTDYEWKDHEEASSEAKEGERKNKNTEYTSGLTSNVDYIINKYNLPSNVTNAWESFTACWGPVAHYTTGEIEYVPYHHGLFGLRTSYIPREKVYEKTLNGGPANLWSICG